MVSDPIPVKSCKALGIMCATSHGFVTVRIPYCIYTEYAPTPQSLEVRVMAQTAPPPGTLRPYTQPQIPNRMRPETLEQTHTPKPKTPTP